MARRTLMYGWVGVAVIGVFTVIIVLGLQLFPRLSAAQNLIDDVRPAMSADRVAGDAAGVAMVSTAVDTLDPAMYPGREDEDWAVLIAVLAERADQSEDHVKDRLMRHFPRTFGLLNSGPLSEVSAELPDVMQNFADIMGLSLPEWQTKFAEEFPKLNQINDNMSKMTGGWDDVPGTENMTRFDGSPVRTAPEIRDYFAEDLIPAFDRQQTHFRALDTRGGVFFLAPVLLALGILLAVAGTIMAVATAHGFSATPNRIGWPMVAVAGVAMMAMVLGLNLFSRLDGGQQLLDDTRAAFTVDRVAGAAAGVEAISVATNSLGPMVLRDGQGQGEVVKLLVMVAEAERVPPLEAKARLAKKFPHTTWLLTAAPFEDVTAERDDFYDYVATALELPPGTGQHLLEDAFPDLEQVLSSLADLTDGWDDVPGTEELTRFDGSPVRTVPELRDYFRDDVIPVLQRQQANFVRVDTTWPPMPVFGPMLGLMGLVVAGYGLVFYLVSRRRPGETGAADDASPAESAEPDEPATVPLAVNQDHQ